jgi:hypothetical protein
MIRQVVVARTAFSTKPSNGAQLHQAWTLFLEDLPDRAVPELRMLGPFGIGDALVFQPGIELDQALHPRLGTEQLIAQVADLVLDPLP